MKNWSDSKKWWMDLVKTALGAFLGIALTVFVISRHEEQRRREAMSWQANLALRVSVIQEFSKAATAYRFGAYDSARDQLRGILPDKSPATRKWRTEVYPNLESAKYSVKQAFPKIDQALLATLTDKEKKIFVATNAAPLFRLGKVPAQCDNENAVHDAWENQDGPPEGSLKETGEDWEIFKKQCFEPVINRYDNTVDTILFHLNNHIVP